MKDIVPVLLFWKVVFHYVVEKTTVVVLWMAFRARQTYK